MSHFIDACRASGTLVSVSMVTSIPGYLIIHGLKVMVFHQQFTLYAGTHSRSHTVLDLARRIIHLILSGVCIHCFRPCQTYHSVDTVWGVCSLFQTLLAVPFIWYRLGSVSLSVRLSQACRSFDTLLESMISLPQSAVSSAEAYAIYPNILLLSLKINTVFW